jgi:hypothetical protein
MNSDRIPNVRTLEPGQAVLQIKTKIVSCHTADSKPVKQEVNGTVILPPSVFPGIGVKYVLSIDIERPK